MIFLLYFLKLTTNVTASQENSDRLAQLFKTYLKNQTIMH